MPPAVQSKCLNKLGLEARVGADQSWHAARCVTCVSTGAAPGTSAGSVTCQRTQERLMNTCAIYSRKENEFISQTVAVMA